MNPPLPASGPDAEPPPTPPDGGDSPGPEPNPEATRVAIVHHKDTVYRIALTHTRCAEDADDVFQEVFLAYHRAQPRCRDEEHRKAWLIRTALNCSRRAAANSWRTRVVPLSVETHEPVAPAAFTFQTETQDAVFREVSALPETYRGVVCLFYFEDLPVARIAELLDIEPGAVKMRLSRGRAVLRDRLQGVFTDD